MSTPAPDSKDHWIYIEGNNGLVRRVDISSATIVYADAVPKEQRTTSPQSALKPGAQIRVTARQDAQGEWRADKIEIISGAAASTPGQKKPDSQPPAPFPDNANVA